MKAPSWWQKPRKVSILVDNESWIMPWADQLVTTLAEQGDSAYLCRSQDEIQKKGIAFYLGCIHLVGPDVLALNHRNLVVHESDLPRGKGFAPLSWQILEGKTAIPVCLIEAVEKADAGQIVYKENLYFEGHELMDEIRWAQGEKTLKLCLRFMQEETPPEGTPQTGKESFYSRRTPKDSRLDPDKTISDQFDKLRVADNNRYPAFFTYRDHCYKLIITKHPIE